MREDKEPFWLRHPIMAIMLAVGLFMGLGAVGWGLKVALSPVRGAGDVIIEQNKAGTRIGSQEELQERYRGIEAICQQIPILRKALEKDPDNFVAQTNLVAAESAYVSRIAEYNAMTRKVTAEKWVGDLPQTIQAREC